ncbi:MAG TPA: HEPN domain-containing protein [Solirubrobacterales bacterium]|nr:HEPN domain-containing protein [Solirubrobacterales bacterium]
MSTSEHHEVARLLLRKAREDFSAAQVLAATENQADHVIGFHLQQTVEKALKSVLAVRGIEIPRSHDLGYLIERLEEAEDELPRAVLDADWLTPWGVLFRYDDDPAVSLDRDRALEAAAAAIGFAEQSVGN